MKQSGSGKRRPDQERSRAIQLYREGYSQYEVHQVMPSVPQSTLNRWIASERESDQTLEIAHVQGAQGRTVGVPLAVWERVAKRITVFSQDAVTGEVQRPPGVFAAAGDPAQIEEQLIEQMREAGEYVPPKYNLPLLVKLRCLDGLGFRRTAKDYASLTKRKISSSTVRRLLKNITVEAADPEGKRVMEAMFMEQAKGEEWMRKAMSHPPKVAPRASPQHPIKRISLTIRDERIGPRSQPAPDATAGNTGA